MLDPPFPPVQCCSTKGANVDHVRVCVVFYGHFNIDWGWRGWREERWVREEGAKINS